MDASESDKDSFSSSGRRRECDSSDTSESSCFVNRTCLNNFFVCTSSDAASSRAPEESETSESSDEDTRDSEDVVNPAPVYCVEEDFSYSINRFLSFETEPSASFCDEESVANNNEGNESIAASARSSSITNSDGGKNFYREHYLFRERVCHENPATKFERQIKDHLNNDPRDTT